MEDQQSIGITNIIIIIIIVIEYLFLIFRGPLRTISSVVPDKNVLVMYGSTEVEPISVILAKEKQSLEVDNPPALCVGRPFVNDSVRIIPVQDGKLIH